MLNHKESVMKCNVSQTSQFAEEQELSLQIAITLINSMKVSSCTQKWRTMTVMWWISFVILELVDISLNMRIENIFYMCMKNEIGTAGKSSSTIGLGIKVIPGGPTEKEDV